jgi:hypothetical protein
MIEKLLDFIFAKSSKRDENKERKFFATHNYEDQIKGYDSSIDKIFLVNSFSSVLDFNARKTKEIIQASKDMKKLYGVWANERDMAHYALDYLIDRNQRWMFNFDVPVDASKDPSIKQQNWDNPLLADPQLKERWIATTPMPFGQLTAGYWVAFYRGIGNFFDEHLKELTDADAFLGFFCKKCDTHYAPDEIKYRTERGHRSLVEMTLCPKKHYV